MRNLFIFLFLFTIHIACNAQDLRSGGRLKPVQANMDIRRYTLVLNVDPNEKTIDGYTEIDLILQQPTEKLLFDLTHVLSVKSIEVNGQTQQFKHDSDLIYITGTSPWQSGRTRVKINYGGKPAVAERAPWKGGFQWEKDILGNPWIAISCQGEGAKIFFPCKDHPSDEPNEGAEMYITVPKGLVVAGPGMLQSVKDAGVGKSTYHWRTNYTINNYCIVFNVGKYKVVKRTYTSVDGNKIPMEFYVLEYNASKAPHHLELLERSCHILEKYFGEYPWAKEKIGIVETPHLGMEHQTMNAYGNKFRYRQVGGKDFDWLMHHEFGHEWWANKVSNKDWAHMWIQEGICSYGDALFVREMEGEEAYQKRMSIAVNALSDTRKVMLADTADSDLAYTGDIYAKGSYFMHSLRFVIGDGIFFPTLKKLATDEQYTYHNMIGTDDVEQLFSKAAGMNLKPFFDFYLKTSERFHFVVKKAGVDSYTVSLQNFNMALPLEITTNQETKRVMVDKKGVEVKSTSKPELDKKDFYFKKITFE